MSTCVILSSVMYNVCGIHTCDAVMHDVMHAAILTPGGGGERGSEGRPADQEEEARLRRGRDQRAVRAAVGGAARAARDAYHQIIDRQTDRNRWQLSSAVDT